MMKKWFLTLCYLCFCSLVWASDESWTALPSEWQFHQTAEPDLHYTDIDVSAWQTVSAPALLKVNPKHGVYAWYKVNFDYMVTDEPLLLFLSRVRHADETWLNGQKIGGLGTITSPWQLAEYPHNLARKYQIPDDILQSTNNTLAIKINVGIGEAWGAMYPGGVGLGGEVISIGSQATVNVRYTQQILHDTIFDTALIVLGIVDILIIIFLFRRSIHHFHEFWWLLIGSVVMMCSAFLLDYFYVLGVTVTGSTLLLLLSLLLSPFVSAMYFWSIHKNIDKRVIGGVALFCLSVVLLMVVPAIPKSLKNVLWIVWSGLTVVLLSYCLISAIIGVRKGYTGARFQLFGLVVFVLSIRTQWLPFDLFEHRNIVVGSLILRYSFLFSYFQRINQMSQDYKILSGRLLSTIENHKKDIARDLHDDLGQHLSAAKLYLLLLSEGSVKDTIDFIKQEIEAAIQSVRELMQGLHPQILEQYPFTHALQRESDRLSKLYQVSIFVTAADVVFNKTIEKHLFRIFQETLHNAIQHGKADEIYVELRAEKHRIRLQVSDNGIGFNSKRRRATQSTGGFGLVSLRERIALLDGRIRVQSAKGEGGIVTVSIPNV